jgi:hypothetical protein
MHCLCVCPNAGATGFQLSFALRQMVGTVGISVIFTNLLSHRYMLERAEIIAEITDMEAEEHNLERLNRILVWEIRAMLLSLLCPLAFFFGQRGVFIALGLFFAATLMADGAFSIAMTKVFLLPVTRVLKMSQGQVDTAASRRLKKTKWFNFVGVGIVVFSSSVLYVHLIIQQASLATGSAYFVRSSWLNPSIISINLDAILNSIGMVLLSGMLKDLSWKGGWRAIVTIPVVPPTVAAPNSVAPQPFQYDSRAYENEIKTAVVPACAGQSPVLRVPL